MPLIVAERSVGGIRHRTRDPRLLEPYQPRRGRVKLPTLSNLPRIGTATPLQAAEKGPSAETHLRWVPPRSRGTATYARSTSRTSPGTHRKMGDAAGYPSEGWVVWTFLSSLGESGFFRILLRHARAEGGCPVPGLKYESRESMSRLPAVPASAAYHHTLGLPHRLCLSPRLPVPFPSTLLLLP